MTPGVHQRQDLFLCNTIDLGEIIEIGLEHARFLVLVYFFLIWTCKKPADYGPQQH